MMPKKKTATKSERICENIMIRTDLINDDIAHFNSIQKIMAKSKNKSIEEIKNTDVIRESLRFANKYYGKEVIIVDQRISLELKKIFKADSIKLKYGFKSSQDLFDHFRREFKKEYTESRRSLRKHLYEILQDLNPKYQKIALLCVQLVKMEKTQGITVDLLKDKSELDEDSIKEALEVLVAEDYLAEIPNLEGDHIYTVK